MGDVVFGASRIRSRGDAVTSPSIAVGVGVGGVIGLVVTVRVGAANSTVKGTSPDSPDASSHDSGRVAVCSTNAPQLPGHRSIVSLTVKVMLVVMVIVPSEFLVTVAVPTAVRLSSNGAGCAPTGVVS